MRIAIDRDKCCGAGQCILSAPRVFDQDDSGMVVLLDSHPPVEQHEAAREAALLCPAAAISIEA